MDKNRGSPVVGVSVQWTVMVLLGSQGEMLRCSSFFVAVALWDSTFLGSSSRTSLERSLCVWVGLLRGRPTIRLLVEVAV